MAQQQATFFSYSSLKTTTKRLITPAQPETPSLTRERGLYVQLLKKQTKRARDFLDPVEKRRSEEKEVERRSLKSTHTLAEVLPAGTG